MEFSALPNCTGKDIFVLGGGPSLKQFDLSRLGGQYVIGCNDAYTFGHGLIDVLVFGDTKWWWAHQENLKRFKSPIVTNHASLEKEERVVWFRRQEKGFAQDGALGWNGNTGAVAINLALILGASRVFLLGFDMELDSEGQSNWHTNELDTPTAEHYKRYKTNMVRAQKDILKNWNLAEIYNLNKNSALECFVKADYSDFIFD